MGIIVIQVNGQAKKLNEGSTIATLIEDMSLDQNQLAVELNHAIFPRSRYEVQLLSDGDCLEIVHAVGGG